MTRSNIRDEIADTTPRALPTRKRKGGASTDPMHIEAHTIPDGMSYEWKRKSILGQSDETHQIDLRENGWSPVPSNRHPERTMSPSSTRPVEYKGMILMERPKELTQEARQEDEMIARRQVRDKEIELGAAPSGTLDRTLHQVRKSYEAGHIPEE